MVDVVGVVVAVVKAVMEIFCWKQVSEGVVVAVIELVLEICF